jgi:hypothetical protein
MDAPTNPLDLAERVSGIARALGIETVLIGAYALAAHRYVRGTLDIDLAIVEKPEPLRALVRALEADGLHARLTTPDDEDPLGGVVRVWVLVDEAGDPIEPLDVVNFRNPHRPRDTPASDAIQNAETVPERPALRYPRLVDVIALKVYAGGPRDEADVLELLAHNPDADREEIRRTCHRYGLERIDALLDAKPRR